MSYLARLKEKISQDAPDSEGSKVSKAPFVPFVAPPPAPLRDILSDDLDDWPLADERIKCRDCANRQRKLTQSPYEWRATIKNPPVIFAKQANIANGPQQVNNGTMPEASRARENKKQQSKLLEADNGERMDTGAASAAGGIDKTMATVGEIDRAENARR